MLYADVQLGGQDVDFYCVQLISPFLSSSLPYLGNYGTTVVDGSVTVENGWEDEQNLQVDKAIAFIRSNSQKTGHPAIIAGDWHSTL